MMMNWKVGTTKVESVSSNSSGFPDPLSPIRTGNARAHVIIINQFIIFIALNEKIWLIFRANFEVYVFGATKNFHLSCFDLTTEDTLVSSDLWWRQSYGNSFSVHISNVSSSLELNARSSNDSLQLQGFAPTRPLSCLSFVVVRCRSSRLCRSIPFPTVPDYHGQSSNFELEGRGQTYSQRFSFSAIFRVGRFIRRIRSSKVFSLA